MRNFRGIIALLLSIILGLIAARAVYWYLNRPKSVERPVKIVAREPEKRKTFSEKIPEGKRVVAIKLDRDSDIPVQLGRGDLVDVAVTSKIPEKEGASITRIILEGIEVYDPGNIEGDSTKKRSSRQEEHIVSLLVSPEDAITILAAKESGKISFIARNKSDEKAQEELSAAYSYENGAEKIKGNNLYSHTPPVPGMRAITLTVKDTDGVLGVLKPRDRVDLIITTPWSKFNTNGSDTPGAEGNITQTSLSSKIFIQDLEILATEKILHLSVGTEAPAQRVTLIVTPDQAVKLAAVSDATKKCVLRFVSRHPEDRSKQEIRHELIDFVADKRAYHRVDIYKGGKEGFKNFFR